MTGFDLSKLGLKKFAPTTEEKKDADSPAQNPSQPAAEIAQSTQLEQASKPTTATLKIGIRFGATNKPSAPAGESPKVPDVFALAQTGQALSPTLPVPTVIEPEEDVEIESGPEGMRVKLDRLDKMIIANSGIDQMSVDTARKYVQDIMIELKTHPEYMGVLVDKDIHNVMTFVRESMNLAQKTFQEVANKRQTKAIKDSKKPQTKFDLSGLGDMSLDGPAVSKQQKQLSAAASAGLDAFANLNVDSIVAKIKK